MTPTTRNEMAKRMFKLKMKKLMQPQQHEQRSSRVTENNSRTDMVVEVSCAGASSERSAANEYGDSEDEDGRLAQNDDSPGDNRVRSPGGTLRLPSYLVERYKEQMANRKRQAIDVDDDDDDDDEDGSDNDDEPRKRNLYCEQSDNDDEED
jgi:hypothetical protein